MKKLDKQFIVACALGDGCINKRIINNKPYYRFLLKHCEKQKDYFFYKINRLENILSENSKKNKKRNSEKLFNIEKHIALHSIKETIAFTYEKGCTDLKFIYNALYKSNKKTFSRQILNQLNEEGLAIWWMDDGCLSNKINKKYNRYSKVQAILNTYLSYEENKVITKYFEEVWNIKWNINKDKNFYRLSCGTKEFRKFKEIIQDYIHPCLNYKIDIKVGQEVNYNAVLPTNNVEEEDIVQKGW